MSRLLPGTAWALRILTAVGVLVLTYYAGVFSSRAEPGSQATVVVKPTVECRLVERHTIHYVDRPVTMVRSVSLVETVPPELRNFNSLEELRQWLAAVDANTTTVYFQSPDAVVDCDDYALDLQRRALDDGYIISFEVISQSEYTALFQSELPSSQSLHAINLAIIGNSAYYIEPQTNEIVFVAYLD